MKKAIKLPNSNQQTRFRKAVAILNKFYEHEEHLTNVVDMLTDLRHLCDVKGLDFYEAERLAYNHYVEERGSVKVKGASARA
jgi:hypothetical protein